MKEKAFNDLLEFEEQDFIDDSFECWQVVNAQMLKDFGPLKKGQIIGCISFDFNTMECTTFEQVNTEDKQTNKFKFNLTAE